MLARLHSQCCPLEGQVWNCKPSLAGHPDHTTVAQSLAFHSCASLRQVVSRTGISAEANGGGGVLAVGFQGGVGVGRDWLQRMGSFGLSEVCSAQLKSSISLPREGIPPSAIEEAPLETVQYSVPSSNPFHSVAQSLSFVSGELAGRRGSRSPSLRLTDPQFSEG